MSEENVETIRRGIDAYNRGDKAAWLDAYDADVVMIPAREWPESSPTRGREALWDFYMEALATWETAAIPELGEGDRLRGSGRGQLSLRGPGQVERRALRLQLLVRSHLPQREAVPGRVVLRPGAGSRSRRPVGASALDEKR